MSDEIGSWNWFESAVGIENVSISLLKLINRGINNGSINVDLFIEHQGDTAQGEVDEKLNKVLFDRIHHSLYLKPSKQRTDRHTFVAINSAHPEEPSTG